MEYELLGYQPILGNEAQLLIDNKIKLPLKIKRQIQYVVAIEVIGK